MAHKKFDRVQETSSSTGSTTMALTAAVTRMRRFGDVLTNGDTCYVLVEHATAAEWQVCLATWNSGHTLTLGAVQSSSTGSAVSFSAGLKTISLVLPAGRAFLLDSFSLNIQTITASATYTPTAGTRFARFRLQAAGGGSGGCTANSGHASAGQSSSAGGYVEKLMTAAQIGATATVTLNGAGAGGAAGNNAGTTAGDSTVVTAGGVTLTAKGGVGGAGGPTQGGPGSVASLAGAGGSTGGDVNVAGGASGYGLVPALTVAVSGKGGDPPSGLGVGGRSASSGGGSAAGNAGSGYGFGSSGAAQVDTGTAAGANGGQPVLIVEEWILVA